jgi:hypothetical protein
MAKVSWIVLIILLVAAPVLAQDGLSEPDLQLVSRIDSAVRALDSTSGYQEKVISKQQLEMTMFMSGMAVLVQSNKTIETESSVIPGSNRNIHSFYTIHSDEITPDGAYSYTLTAEVRLVDGVIYVMAERIPDEGSVLPATLDPVPSGWTQIDDPTAWPSLDDLDLDSLLTAEMPFDFSTNADELAQLAPIFTVETVTWGDGTLADVVSITIPVESMMSEAGQTAMDLTDGFMSSMLSYLDPTSSFSMDYTIGSAGNLLRGRLKMFFKAEGVDATLEDNTLPAGTTYDLLVDMSETRKISGINQVLVPVTAP